MLYTVKLILSACLLSLLILVTSPAYADSSGISKQQAVSIAQKANPGRVLSVKLKGDTYKVKTLSSSGEVRIISVNANSGKVSGR